VTPLRLPNGHGGVAVDEFVMVVESAEHDEDILAPHAERGAWSDAPNGEFKLTLPLGEAKKWLRLTHPK
jgi:hypothetical protein